MAEGAARYADDGWSCAELGREAMSPSETLSPIHTHGHTTPMCRCAWLCAARTASNPIPITDEAVPNGEMLISAVKRFYPNSEYSV